MDTYKLQMTNIIPFESWHIAQLKLQPHEAEMLDINRFLGIVNNPGNDCRSYFHDGKLLGIFGYQEFWAGCIDFYLMPSIYIFEYPIVAYKAAKKGLALLKLNPNIHRIQASCLDCPTRIKFMEYMGFTLEGTLRNYTKKQESYKMWAWVRGLD
jgi:hypothetical protein